MHVPANLHRSGLADQSGIALRKLWFPPEILSSVPVPIQVKVAPLTLNLNLNLLILPQVWKLAGFTNHLKKAYRTCIVS